MLHTETHGDLIHICQGGTVVALAHKHIPTEIVRGRVSAHIRRRPQDWDGTYDVTVAGDLVGNVTSPAEALVLIARGLELLNE